MDENTAFDVRKRKCPGPRPGSPEVPTPRREAEDVAALLAEVFATARAHRPVPPPGGVSRRRWWESGMSCRVPPPDPGVVVLACRCVCRYGFQPPGVGDVAWCSSPHGYQVVVAMVPVPVLPG